tara:strand:- start:573 stop:743 length:171 start_codon:yes stop_codon:yes gene_type:complete
MKKRKLNSKNPKFEPAAQIIETEPRRELICEAPTRSLKGKITSSSRKAKIYAIFKD